MLSLGIDSGSATTKAVLFDGKQISACRMSPTTMKPGQVLRNMYRELATDQVGVTVSTGYGRNLLPEADRKITEITCHGAGAFWLCPECRAVIDIGGQDSKVILLDENGQVTDFLMNDKCAAGTGRFVEMTLERVNCSPDRLDDFVKGCTPVAINSMCAVFAESEIVGLLAREENPGDIVLGCVHSICRRTAAFARKLVPEGTDVFFSGGLARSGVMQEMLEFYLKQSHVYTHSLAQYTGAVGAAVLGYQKYCIG